MNVHAKSRVLVAAWMVCVGALWLPSVAPAWAQDGAPPGNPGQEQNPALANDPPPGSDRPAYCEHRFWQRDPNALRAAIALQTEGTMDAALQSLLSYRDRFPDDASAHHALAEHWRMTKETGLEAEALSRELELLDCHYARFPMLKANTDISRARLYELNPLRKKLDDQRNALGKELMAQAKKLMRSKRFELAASLLRKAEQMLPWVQECVDLQLDAGWYVEDRMLPGKGLYNGETSADWKLVQGEARVNKHNLTLVPGEDKKAAQGDFPQFQMPAGVLEYEKDMPQECELYFEFSPGLYTGQNPGENSILGAPEIVFENLSAGHERYIFSFMGGNGSLRIDIPPKGFVPAQPRMPVMFSLKEMSRPNAFTGVRIRFDSKNVKVFQGDAEVFSRELEFKPVARKMRVATRFFESSFRHVRYIK